MPSYPKMKNSGVEWFGKIPVHWRINALFQLFTQVKNKNLNLMEHNLLSLSYGKIKRKDIDTTDGLLPSSFDGYNIIDKGDIVLRLTDLQNDHTSLRVGRATEHGIITSAYTTIRPMKPETSKFLYYVIYSFDIKKGFYGMGSGVRQGLNYDEAKMLKLPIPPHDEQQRIVANLDTACADINAAISEAKASIEDYKLLKQSIITQAVTKGLDPNVPMKDSGVEWIGQIPRNWEVGKIKYFASLSSGGTPKSDHREYYDNGTINWVCSLDLHESEIHTTKSRLTDFGLKNCAGSVHPADSVMIAMYGGSGTIGNSGIIKVPSATNQAICSMTFGEKIIGQYAFYYMRAIRQYWMIYAVGTRKDPNISQNTVANMPIVLPSVTEQKQTVQALDKQCKDLDLLINTKSAIVDNLELYKRSLIYEVVTGKRKVV